MIRYTGKTSIPGKNKVRVIGKDDSIYFYDRANKKWREVPGYGKGLDICSYNGTTFIIGTDYHIYSTQ